MKTDKFGRRMERSGKGGYNRQSRDVCVADHRYTKNVLEFFLDCMEKFDINYWKLDGFLLKSCKNRHHGHPVGGKHGMYCFTDCWENWTDIFEKCTFFARKRARISGLTRQAIVMRARGILCTARAFGCRTAAT